MYNEVLMHSLANAANVGPILIDFSENFILMEFIDGRNIVDWSVGDSILTRRYIQCDGINAGTMLCP